MNYMGIDGSSCEVSLRGGTTYSPNKSKLHNRARAILEEIHPTDVILQEITLPVSKKVNLFVDLFLPVRLLMVEVQGEQHYKFVQHFHGNKISFTKSLTRDKMKRTFCRLNEIRLVELPWNETDEQWKSRILGNSPSPQ